MLVFQSSGFRCTPVQHPLQNTWCTQTLHSLKFSAEVTNLGDGTAGPAPAVGQDILVNFTMRYMVLLDKKKKR